MRKMLAILALSFATLLAAPGAALAYGDDEGAGSVQPGTVTEGGEVEFSGCGFVPGATITIAEDGEVEGTVVADAEGCFSTTVTVNGTGDSVLTATGADGDGEGDLVVSATVRVLAASGGAGGTDDGLPVTGAEGTATQVWAGIGLLGMGAGLVALTVSRRRAATIIA